VYREVGRGAKGFMAAKT